MSDLFSETPPSIPSSVNRHANILSALRARLFDTSKRNRLLYFKAGSRFVNLTAGSMPMSQPPKQATILFTYNSIDRPIMGMKPVPVNEFLHFKAHPYLQPQLNNVRLQAESDEKEYGFSQLHLVITFLHWQNVKEEDSARIQSPLLLLPVKLKRNKGVQEDKFTLEILDNVAIVNPILAHQLKELFGIELPESLPFEQISLMDFYRVCKTKLEAAAQDLQLHYKDDPDNVEVFHTARNTIHTYLKRLGRPLTDIPEVPAPAAITLPPLHWEFDATQLVLGNFNYKKMSLVSDYNQTILQGGTHPVFSALFSDQPKAPVPEVNVQSPVKWYHVISADPAQTNAILQHRNGHSYVIQGPPGTGKSQTITNLIADCLAQSKTVLFVCEKRAALDVVYHRLQQRKLSELCCYIHDSQADKKTFVQDLKTVYDDFLKTQIDFTHITLRRNVALEHLQRQLHILQSYHDQQNATHADAGLPTRQLIATLLQLQPHLPAQVQEQPQSYLPAQTQEQLPPYRYWMQFGDTLEELSRALERQQAAPQLALHPFRALGNGLIQDKQAFTLINHLAAHTQGAIEHITRIIINNQIPSQYTEQLSNLMVLVKTAAVLGPIAESRNLQLVDPANKEAKRFEKAYKQYRQLQKAYKQAGKRNLNWTQKFSEQEVQQAITIAEKYERSFLRYFSGSWRRLKKQLLKAYNFSAHQLPPAFSVILQQLRDEYAAQEKAQQHLRTMKERYRTDNLTTMQVGLEALRRQLGDERMDYLLQHPQANDIVMQLSSLNNTLHQLELQLQQALHQYEQKSLWQVHQELTDICAHAAQLQKLLPALQDFAALPADLQDIIRRLPLTPQQAQAAMAHFTLQSVYDQYPTFAATQQGTLQQAVKEITQTYQLLLQLNGDYIRASRRHQFLQHYTISNTSATQLSPDQKLLKKRYAEGRRMLEHEMSKTMRFRSIRELASLESSVVLRDLKPVWLMSPLSVSDSLPLDPRCFDVVIFDEASQIPLEEGIPALFRAPQAVIVGDEKQMPPAQFFSSGPADAEEAIDTEDDLDPDADSLLVQGAAKLPGAMLRWHYRSRYEALISYSNHAFYGADLLTIPDNTLPPPAQPLLTVQSPEEGEVHAQQVLQHSISYHYMPNGIYENRNNLPEARYIAYMVKSLLSPTESESVQQPGESVQPVKQRSLPVKESIGIVAFSQEQQQAIINAINTLAAEDRAFEAALELAYSREEEGQYTGLFIKNLENVQGDERDIILISICYGHDSQQQMRMHFGPINRRGGEKRLNVIFSRAKKHMAIISSIRHQHITNEHNDGARYFKRFLHYAEMISTGDAAAARKVLDSLLPPGKAGGNTADVSSITTQQVKAALEAQGYIVHESVGQSSFRCSLAVKKDPTDTHYSLGILLDDAAHYQHNNVAEQYYQRPALLQAFGWKVAHVYAKDWLEDRSYVLHQLLSHLK